MTGGLLPPDSAVLRAGRYSVLVPRRGLAAALLLGLVAAGVVAGAVVADAGMLTPAQSLAALFGSGDSGAVLLVQEYRLPRIVAGVLAGAALGAAGCLTQALAGNRLATPDIMGINEGATLAVLVSVLGSTTGMIGAWWIGPVGAMAAAGFVLLAAGRADGRGYRVLVVGVGVGAMLTSVIELLLSRQQLGHATAVYAWSIGSLAGRGYPVAVPVALILAALLPLALVLGRHLAVLGLGRDTATALGVPPHRTGLAILAIATALAGVGVGVGGPISFVALAAPILAARLASPSRPPLVGAAVCGAALVVAADALGRSVGPGELPVGVVTSLLGGPFLLWSLLSRPSERT
ncbi:MAG TPA: iron chelate uptake ABC transporter family permease subunit [Micromonosporaceae bacterium]|nr:iron chelate uptake ABC transporter family permease subunit [Micromonosporaceae bacterium]